MTFSPASVILNPGDSVKILVSVTLPDQPIISVNANITANSNYSPFKEAVSKYIIYKLPTNLDKLQAKGIELHQYPNPVKGIGNIEYRLLNGSNINISIYDATGKEVLLLANGYKSPGNYKVSFNSEELQCGINFFRFICDDDVITQKLIVYK